MKKQATSTRPAQLTEIFAVLYQRAKEAQAQQRFEEACTLYQKAFAACPPGRAIERVNLSRFQGDMLSALGREQDAFSMYRRALSLAEENGLTLEQAMLCNNLGHALEHRGEMSEALDMFKQALQLGEMLQNESVLASALYGMAQIYRIQGDFRKAYDTLQRVYFLDLRRGHGADISATLHELATVHKHRGESSAAKSLYEQAKQMDQAHGDQRSMASSMFGVASIYALVGQHQKALELMMEVLALRETLGVSEALSPTLLYLSILYQALEQPKEAMVYGQRALLLAEEHNDMQTKAKALGQIAQLIVSEPDRHPEALQMARDSLALLESMQAADVDAAAALLSSIEAVVPVTQDSLKAAAAIVPAISEEMVVALPTSKEIPRTISSMSKALVERAVEAEEERAWDRALSLYRRALNACPDEDHEEKAKLWIALGELHAFLEQIDDAVGAYQQALERCQGEITIASATVLPRLSRLQLLEGNSLQALHLCRKAVEHARALVDEEPELLNDALDDLAKLYTLRGDIAKAYPLWTEVLFLDEQQERWIDVAGRLRDLAIIHRQRREWVTALVMLRQALQLSQELQESVGEAEAWCELGRSYFALGESAQAIACFEKAVKFYEEGQCYDLLPEFLLELGDVYRQFQKPQEALRCYARAVDEAEEIGEAVTQADALRAMAQLHAVHLGEYEEGVTLAKEALALYEQLQRTKDASVMQTWVYQWGGSLELEATGEEPPGLS